MTLEILHKPPRLRFEHKNYVCTIGLSYAPYFDIKKSDYVGTEGLSFDLGYVFFAFFRWIKK
jgi:hypothetical protein